MADYKVRDPKGSEGETFLISVSNEQESDMVESILRAYNIPVLKKRKGIGGYLNIYMGMNLYGVDLYVPSSSLNTAKELINGLEQKEEKDETIEEERNRFQQRRLKRVRILLAIFYIPAAIGILFSLGQIIRRLLQ